MDSLLSNSGEPNKNPIADPSENLTSNLGLVFIDFETMTDSAIVITDSMLIDHIDLIGTDSLSKILLTDKPKNLNDLANPHNIEISNIPS